MSWVIYNRELSGFLTEAPDNHTYFSSVGERTRRFTKKEDAIQFIRDNPSHSFPDSPWYNREPRVVINEKSKTEILKEEIINNCKVEYMRDTDKCESCPLKEGCPKLKEIKRRYNDAWYEAVMEYGD